MEMQMQLDDNSKRLDWHIFLQHLEFVKDMYEICGQNERMGGPSSAQAPRTCNNRQPRSQIRSQSQNQGPFQRVDPQTCSPSRLQTQTRNTWGQVRRNSPLSNNHSRQTSQSPYGPQPENRLPGEQSPRVSGTEAAKGRYAFARTRLEQLTNWVGDIGIPHNVMVPDFQPLRKNADIFAISMATAELQEYINQFLYILSDAGLPLPKGPNKGGSMNPPAGWGVPKKRANLN